MTRRKGRRTGRRLHCSRRAVSSGPGHQDNNTEGGTKEETEDCTAHGALFPQGLGIRTMTQRKGRRTGSRLHC
ncbi:hypothetical protein ACOMHN_000118 [Nucella lapillus]